MEEATRLCSRIGIIDHGKILALGTLEANVNNMERQSGYITSAVPRLNPERAEQLRRASMVDYCKANGYDPKLLDKEDASKLAPAGEPGELAVHGPQVMRGYWNRPESDADTFVDVGGKRYLRTGDVVDVRVPPFGAQPLGQ